ncbi:MAG: LacI family DNA-binding transcriptional regulator [bacterium]
MPREGRVTIYKIAEELGVSPSTVSRALNNTGRMSQELRNKIVELAKKYNYIPNEAAKGLRTKSSMLLGLIVPDIANPYYVNVARGAQDEADRYGYSIAICNTDDKPDLEKKRIITLVKKQVDGLLVFNFFNNKDTLELLKTLSVPIILFNPPPRNYKFVHIKHDTSVISSLLAYLLNKSYRKIAHIAGDQRTIVGTLRLRHFVHFLKSHNIPLKEEWIIESDFTYKGGYDAMKRLLSLEERPRAVWASNDMMAIGAMDAIKEAGLSVPKDIAVAGCDDIEYASLVSPKLTTIYKPKYELGTLAVKLLVNLIRGEEISIETLKDELIIRESA